MKHNTVDSYLGSIKIIYNPFLFLSGNARARVISKHKIYTKTKSTRKLFRNILTQIKYKHAHFIYGIEPRDIRFFLHELRHTFQSHDYPFWERVVVIILGHRLSHDDRPYEKEAEAWAKTHYRKSPDKLYQEIEKLLN